MTLSCIVYAYMRIYLCKREEVLLQMVDIFKALSEDSRLRILALLLDKEMCVCEIEACLKMTQSNASRHLTILKNCGILEGYKNAQWAFYRINDNFKLSHIDLWKYLQVKLKEAPTYQIDYDECEKCKTQNLCHLSNRETKGI